MAYRHAQIEEFSGSVSYEEKYGNARIQLGLSEKWVVFDMVLENDVQGFDDVNPRKQYDRFYLRSFGTKTYFIKGSGGPYICPSCLSPCGSRGSSHRTLSHLPDKGYTTRLEVDEPRLNCKQCGYSSVLPFPAAQPRRSSTRDLERAIMKDLLKLTFDEIAKRYGIDDKTVSSCMSYHVRMAIREQDLSYVTGFHVDEVQWRPGLEFMTVITDQFGYVIFCCLGRDKSTLELFRSHLVVQGGDPENIRWVSADMSPAFLGGVREYFPNANMVWDRFHIIQALQDDLDLIRKQSMRKVERDGREAIGNPKNAILYKYSNMNKRSEDILESIRLYNPTLALAFDLKEEFLLILDSPNKATAKMRFDTWYDRCKESNIGIMSKRAGIFKQSLDMILNWFDYPESNGSLESLNGRIKKLRANACGFRNPHRMMELCLYRFGNLEITY